MDDAQFGALAAWLAEAGLKGLPETDMVTEFCHRLVSFGMPLARAQMFIDTLHPVHGGSAYFWQAVKGVATTNEYEPLVEGEQMARWRRSAFYRLIETGEPMLRRRVDAAGTAEFPFLADLLAIGMTDYIALIDRFGEDAVIGEMDAIYSSWVSDAPEGFSDAQTTMLRRLTPSLGLAIKSGALVRIARTLLETYLGRDPARRVLKGSIMRGATASIEAVLWYSDLHDYTRISDRARPDQIIPLLDDYADTIITAIYDQGGDVLKLIGDGTLAIFTAEDRGAACRAALTAAQRAFDGVRELKARRLAEALPATDIYLGLHVGEVVYGNFGARERLDFTVVGAAVNEVSRIAAMCRLVDQPILVSSAFADAVGSERDRLVSVGRYALRGVGMPQHLFTLDATIPPADDGA